MINLIQNAVRHNIQGGLVQIIVDDSNMLIENTGPIVENPSTIFDRFSRSEQSINSVGLGLAIVREIAHVSGVTISYQFQDDKNCFTLVFEE